MRDYIDESYDYQCSNCKNNPNGGLVCKAFDIIPEEYLNDARKHNKVVPGQKGDFVFEQDQKDVMRIYVMD